MEQPFLSIITINYNDKNGLKKTIASVLKQTYQDFEYIVIDGGSTDGSETIIKQYVEDFSYSVSEPDTGIYNAMNKGIKQAKGKYLQFLNSGDIFTSSNALNDFIGNSDFEGDIIYGDYKFENGEKIYPDQLTPLFFMRSSLPHQSTLFRSGLFNEMGLYDETLKISADRSFYIKCFLADSFIFKHITYPLVLFDLSGKSNTKDYKKMKTREDTLIFERHFGIFSEDYKNHLALEQELYRTRAITLSGWIKRIKRKFGLS